MKWNIPTFCFVNTNCKEKIKWKTFPYIDLRSPYLSNVELWSLITFPIGQGLKMYSLLLELLSTQEDKQTNTPQNMTSLLEVVLQFVRSLHWERSGPNVVTGYPVSVGWVSSILCININVVIKMYDTCHCNKIKNKNSHRNHKYV